MASASNPAAPVRMEVEDGVAVVTIDDPSRPVNVLSQGVIAGFEQILERLERGAEGVRAVVIRSGKPKSWIAGADIEDFTKLETAADGERMSREGNELLDRLEALALPVVAAIRGAALGGGSELALACTYRMAADDSQTKLGFPEVQLGLLPGAGGSRRLPRLIGLAAALDLMLTGKRLDPGRARALGLVDEVVAPAVLPDAAVRAARELAGGERAAKRASPRGSPKWLERLPGVKQLILKKARDQVMAKTRGLYPAPLKIIEVVGRGIGLAPEEARALEERAFGELSVTDQARALVHLFFATTGAKGDAGVSDQVEADEVERMAVVGAGFMGAGIATVAAERGVRVRMKDTSPEAAARGLAGVRASLLERASKRRRPEREIDQLLSRVEATDRYTGFANADLIVEAVFEEVELKQEVIREIEDAAPGDAVLGSNTSTIPISRLAEAASRPERLIGLHFFSPVEKMPLLEIVVTPQTSERTTATSHRFAKALGKTPIVVRDGPGFYTSRVLAPYMNEAALLLEQGVRIEAIDRAMLEWGFPVGPLTLYDEVGLDVAAKVSKVLAEAFGDRLAPGRLVSALAADGRKGRKNGRGVYRYDGGQRKGPDESVYQLIGSPEPVQMSPRRIQARLALAMVNEAVRCLEDGVLRTPRDGDVGAVLGLGFPPFRGGPFWYVDRTGAARVVDQLRSLAGEHGARFTPAPPLRELAARGELFFPSR